MREVTITGLDDGLKYTLGYGVDLVYAVDDLGRKIGFAEGSTYLTSICIVDGKTLISFIRKNAPEEEEIIEKIKEENRYELIAWDW